MNDKKCLKEIIDRLGYEILYEDEKTIQFEKDSYGDLTIEFNEKGFIIGIY